MNRADRYVQERYERQLANARVRGFCDGAIAALGVAIVTALGVWLIF